MRERADAFDKFRPIKSRFSCGKGPASECANGKTGGQKTEAEGGGRRRKEEGQIERQPEGDGDRNSSMDN